eukprot:TRINITY_DN3094_c0_g2_i5.p1 TRINITY_DN3094_c0_g2~~TRINITY_DN3094_c0_g2_i5.p1  ORF type:complete len:110 (+),score=18.09 TRINITY_DN3094_c0_g2_i5:386-715(+)
MAVNEQLDKMKDLLTAFFGRYGSKKDPYESDDSDSEDELSQDEAPSSRFIKISQTCVFGPQVSKDKNGSNDFYMEAFQSLNFIGLPRPNFHTETLDARSKVIKKAGNTK